MKVSVSVITIEGTSCKLGLLGEIASKTGGLVNVVNPINLKEQFSNILEDRIIATNVIAELILPKELYIKDHENFDNRQSTVKKQIGNVTKETELTFEFSVRDVVDIKSQQLPFQLKISYNSLNGATLLRVLTKIKQLTDNQDLAEESCNRAILATNAIQIQGRLLQKNPNKANLGHYSEYVTKVRTKKNDFFSADAYSMYQTDLSQTINSAQTMVKENAKQAYQRLNDKDASKLYNLQRINAKDLLNKKK
ncbi:type A von Willebrand factor domain-containing [Brachionus plicatilis]|uniref:Type A von Willebrand factor domain-containing n=1 Tax=Brachionus plicatilis TaxID=10195 RepID=A0A3M7P6Y1_BRAPC|nr:type A von Willebrand factor domain-containing [Brachionus plicatilis]